MSQPEEQEVIATMHGGPWDGYQWFTDTPQITFWHDDLWRLCTYLRRDDGSGDYDYQGPLGG